MITLDEHYEEDVGANASVYLRNTLGPKFLPLLTVVLPITVVYVVIFATGMIGNIVTFIVILKNPSMQTVTNYYLFNLAASDVLFLIFGLPSELSVYWQQYPWTLGVQMCKLRAFVSETCSYVSVLTIVIFSTERYMAICHPLRRYAGRLKRSLCLILLAWLIAIGSAIPFYVYINVSFLEYPEGSKRFLNESALCMMRTEDIPEFPLYEFSCVVFFLLPMVFIAVLYVRMGLRIQSSSLEHGVEGSVHGETRQAQSRRIIIRMLGAVVITFFICWAPYHAQRLLYVHWNSGFHVINQWLYPLSGVLYYLSATLNPILYNVMSVKYRNAFRETLCCFLGNLSKTSVDHSSTRDSSTGCGSVSRRESQRTASNYNHQRSIKYDFSTRGENASRALNEFETTEGEERKRSVAGTNSDEIVAKRVPKKFSFRRRTENGRRRYQMSSKEESFSKETRI